MKLVREFLKTYNFPETVINKIVKNETVNEYTEEVIVRHLKENIELFTSYGFEWERVVCVFRKYPVLSVISSNLINNVIMYFEKLNYSQERIIKMISMCPNMLGRNTKTLSERLARIESLGYTETEVLYMFGLCSIIVELSIENLQQKITDIMSLGYTQSEVHDMTVRHPQLFSDGFPNIREKVKLLKSLGLEDIIIKDTKKIMQSVKKTYARVRFLESRGEVVTKENCNRIFNSSERFYKIYKISDEELYRLFPLTEREERKI